MARKSRKNVEVIQTVKETSFDVGAYVRLSAVDRKQKGDSIDTQQNIISAFVAEHSDLCLREVYIDNGLSGQSFDRPAFKRMIEDLESGKINCCVTKDLSRLGRNAIDTGYYIEKYFPSNGIRFIAINDNYDSAYNNGAGGGIMINLKNMVNESYALEIGRKVRTTKQMNIRNGCFVGRIPPYGYLKSKEDGHKLVPDEYAAPIVRHMFDMAAEGHGVREIQKWLNDSGIFAPRYYYYSIGLVSEKEAKQTRWNRGVVYNVLRNRVYCGDMVQGKGKTHSYVVERIPESEWIITENTHEGIVSRNRFDEVQKLWNKNKEQSKSYYSTSKSENVLLSKVFCAHCGYTMRRVRTSENSYRFMCQTRQFYGENVCIPVSINENELKDELLIRLQSKAYVFRDNKKLAELTVKSNEANNAELSNLQAEIKRNSRFLKGLYESLFTEMIDSDEYKELKNSYEIKIAKLIEREKTLRESGRECRIKKAELSKTADSMQSIHCINDLTSESVDRLIDKILVFEDKRIEVNFKFNVETEVANCE